MRSRSSILAAAVLALGASAPALAQAAADQDVRCLIAGNAFGSAEKDPAKRQLALATALFFAGRADARLSPAQLKAQIIAQGKALTTATVADVMTACARSFQQKELALQAIGHSIVQAQAPAPVPPKK